MPDTTAPGNRSARGAAPLAGLSPGQAFSIGTAVGNLLAQGMPRDRALPVTNAVAEFVRRGITAQEAVDEILAGERRTSRRKRPGRS